MSTRAILDFETIGFIKPTLMRNGSRHYSEQDAEILKFLKQAFTAGFSMKECEDLLRIYFQHPQNKYVENFPTLAREQNNS